MCNSSILSDCLELLKFTTDPRQIGVLRQVLSSRIVYGSYTLEPFAHEADIKAFIEYGIARTKSKSKEDVIDEPLAIMAVSHNQNETEQVVLEFAKNQYDEAQV